MPRVLNPEKGRLTSDTLEKVEESSELMTIVNQKFLEDNGLSIGNKNDMMVSSDVAESNQDYIK